MENSKKFHPTILFFLSGLLFFLIYILKMISFGNLTLKEINSMQLGIAYNALLFSTILFIIAVFFLIWEVVTNRKTIIGLIILLLASLGYIAYLQGFDMASFTNRIFFPNFQ